MDERYQRWMGEIKDASLRLDDRKIGITDASITVGDGGYQRHIIDEG